MGGKCCNERKDTLDDGRQDNKGHKSSRVPTHPTKGYERKNAPSIGYALKGDDAERFGRAFEATDLQAFVALLASRQPMEKFEEKMHPWAEDPLTVGCLAGTQLAIIASGDDDPRVKDAIREAGAIPIFVEFLKSGEVDRMQTAVVALSFLTGDCSGNAIAAYDCGVMPLMLKHLDSQVAGMRAGAATTLRNICMEKEEYRMECVDSGGIEGFVGLLELKLEVAVNANDVQLEAVLNLQDILECDDGSVHPAHAKKAKAAGAVEKLSKLLKSDDEEVHSSVEELLAALQDPSTLTD